MTRASPLVSGATSPEQEFTCGPPTRNRELRWVGALEGEKAIREHRRLTGMIYQQHQLIRRHTALRNTLTGRLGYHTALRGLLPLPREDQRIALDCLERVGILTKARFGAAQAEIGPCGHS